MRSINFDTRDIRHTKYGLKVLPFTIVMDIKTINQLDRFEYLPRLDGRNGIIMKGSVEYSLDKNIWNQAGAFEWKKDNSTKTFNFPNHPTARYLKISVTEAVNNYGSGRELYVFKVPETK